MKRRIILILVPFLISLVLLMAGCSSSLKTDSNYQTELKVMTFNIRYGTANDGENSWNYRKNFVFEIIRENDPDILGIQEALDFQIDELLKELPGYSYVGVGRDDGKTKGEFSAILYAKERFILDTTETFWLADNPKLPGSKTWESTLPRICTWAQVFDKFSKKSLFVLNVHFDHQSQISREKSSDLVIEKIKLFAKDLPVILTGDFNCGEENMAIRKILEYGLHDSYRTLNPKTSNEGTFNGFIGDRSGDRIDYIFVNNKFEILNSKIDSTNFNGRYPSDHFPVISIVKYK